MQNLVKGALSGIASGRRAAACFLVMLMVSLASAQDSFTTGVVSEITAIKSELYIVGGAIIGVAVVFVIYRFVRGMLGR
jgi:hypothetical protein